MNLDETYFDDFIRYSESPQAWYWKAYHLMGAAGVLWASRGEQRSKELVEELGLDTEFSMGHAFRRPYLLLCGLSLELLFKAIVVAKGEKPDTKSHSLPELASKAGVQVTKKEEALLTILSKNVMWAGRYPVPSEKAKGDIQKLASLESRHLWNSREVPGGMLIELLPGTQLDWEHFHQLWKHADKLYRHLEKQRNPSS